jgi:hypothetical protein
VNTPNWKAPQLIAERKDFTGSNFYGMKYSDGSYVIYSYNTKIAEITSEGIVWITTRSYSNTTAKHLSHVRQGIANLRDVVWARTLDHAKTTTKWRDLVGN